MPSKKEITVVTLIPLGSTKLAEILIELANSDSDIEKRLERVLLSASSPKKLATSLKKQIISLAKSKRFYDYYQSDKYVISAKAYSFKVQDRTNSANVKWKNKE